MPNKRPAISVLPVARELTDDVVGKIVEAAQRRAALMAELRDALMTGENELALRLARQATGLERELPRQ
jgi:hypothetical protein